MYYHWERRQNKQEERKAIETEIRRLSIAIKEEKYKNQEEKIHFQNTIDFLFTKIRK